VFDAAVELPSPFLGSCVPWNFSGAQRSPTRFSLFALLLPSFHRLLTPAVVLGVAAAKVPVASAQSSQLDSFFLV
jgi:hypothetical protein